jgi:membrane dipeptidase
VLEQSPNDGDGDGSSSKRNAEDGTDHTIDKAKKFADSLLDSLFAIEDASKGEVKIAHTVDEIRACLEAGVLATIIHFEGAEMIETDLGNLAGFYDRGLRSLGITWSRPNQFGHGVPFAFEQSPDTGPGLTDAGEELVRECNRLGIMIDLSHLNEKGFWDVVSLTDSPLVVTHSAAHAICPSTRNLTDRQIDAVGRSGGVVGINFHVGFIRPDGKKESDTPLQHIVNHLDYVVDRIGIDHVALGSDFDGATMPDALGDVSGLPKLLLAIRESGYGEQEIRKIAHENWLRVLRQTWKDS